MEQPDIRSYLKILSLYNEQIGCLDTEIQSPFDGKCYSKESPIGKSIENLLKLISDIEQPPIEIITEPMEKEIVSSGFKVGEFIVKYISQYDNIDSFLNYEKSDSPGYIFEFLWTLCIAFGVVDDRFPMSKFEILDINVNTSENDTRLDLHRFLNQSVRSGNKGGYSDITLKQKVITYEEKKKALEKDVCDPNYTRINSSYIFFTSKFYKKDKSASEKYDLHKIKSLFSIDNDAIYHRYSIKNKEGKIDIPRIVILLNNKEDFLKSKENIRRSSKHLYKNFDETTDILDKYDLQYYYTKLRNMLNLFEYNLENIVTFLNKKYMCEKEILQPRLHQLMFVFKTIDCLSRDIRKEVIWGAVARSGKTFIMGEFINFLNTANTIEKDWKRCYDGQKKIPLLDKPRDYPWTFIVFSPVINETKKQYIDELFKKYLEFDEFKTHDLQGKDSVLEFIDTYSPKKQILIISKQTVGREQEEENQYLSDILQAISLKGGIVDGIFFDEHHMGGTSKISRNLLDSIRVTNPNIFMIFITATFNKSVFNFNIDNSNIISWDYEDIMNCKDLTNPDKKKKMIDKTAHRSGEKSYFTEALDCLNRDGFSDADIEREYRRYPNIFLLSNIWNEHNVLKLFENHGKQSFNMNSIFEVKELDEYNNHFKFPESINNILDIIAGNPHKGYSESTDNINTWCYFERMRNLSAIEGSRKVFTQLWFLPHGKSETRIKYVAANLKKLMEKHAILKKYEIITTLDDEFNKKGKDYIKSKEQYAFQKDKAGLIILTGKKLSLGVSLPCADAVIMLNSIGSPDLYYQMIFRALTESPGKKLGFIIDFNPERVLSTIYHQLFARGSKGKQDLREDAEDKFFGSEPLIYIDYDLIIDKTRTPINMIDLFHKFNITGSKYEFVSMLSINNDIIREINQNLKLDANLIRQFNEMGFNELVVDRDGPKKIKHTVTLGDEDDVKLHEMRTADIMKTEGVTRKEAMKDRTKEHRASSGKLNFDLGYFLLPIIKISTFLTSKFKEDLSFYQTMVKMFEPRDNLCDKLDEPIHSLMDAVRYYLRKTDIFKDPQQLNLLISIIDPSNENNILRNLDSIPNIQGRRTDIIKNIENIQNLSEEVGIDSIDDTEFDRAISERCKDGKCELIPNILDKKALLEYIEENLNPIKELKKGTGEVFTPWELVDEMLRTVPEEFWTNPNHKILEPGSGFGPFAIWVYYKLMRSLVEDFPNEELRRKHIIENMLYMAELNPVNVEICRNIFDPMGKYKLNLYCGDFLELNSIEEWGVRQFDLICGNPPYNKEKGNARSEMPLYNEFIEKCIDNCVFLLFLIPSRWFTGGKGLDVFREMMLSRKDIKLIKHFENSQDIFGTCVDIKGGVCYFLKDSNYHGLCNVNQSLIDLSKYDILLTNKNVYSIVDKVITLDNLSDIYISNSYFGIKTNFENFTDNDKLVKCYVSQQKGFIKFIDKKYIKKDYNFWKVITPKAAGKGNDGFGNIFIGKPIEIHSESYISFKVENEKEANYLMSYLKSNFVNFMLSLKKISQVISEKTVSWIPLVPLDREWNNDDIYKYLNITPKEIQEIEKTIGISSSKLKEKLPKVVNDTQLSLGQSAKQQQQHDDDEFDEDDAGVTEDEEDFTSARGALAAQHIPEEQPKEDICVDETLPIKRQYNEKLKYFTEKVCDVVYLFKKEDDKIPHGYLSYGKIERFSIDLILEFERCLENKTSVSCVGNCKWVRPRSPNPGRCELKAYPVKSELTKYSNYLLRSRRADVGGMRRKTRRPKK